MNIDPIVLLAYVSVSINVITMIAACIAYAIFHVRKHRRKKTTGGTPEPSEGPLTPVFLRPYVMAAAVASPAAAAADDVVSAALAEPASPALAEPQ